jgi:hypothetical protein
MKVSKFIKAHKDILVEYIYDDGNNISESYKVLVNIKDNSYSYVAGDSSSTGNTTGNQLFKIDGVTNNYGLVDTTNYSFLQLKDYASGFPLRNDIIKVHLPINYTFGEYIGCYLRVYTFDYNNEVTYDLSNFYFDTTDVDQSYLLNYNSPPLLFQEKLWGKNITINVPSVFAVANQRVNGYTKANSVNFNLTNGTGLSLNSPIFIDFHFITSKRTVNKVKTYYLNAKTPISLPQTPDFEKLGVKVINSVNGDFFEIYGVYNDNISEFKSFIDNSVQLGNRYYVEYLITLYEQNIRGKSFKIVLTDNFNEKVEYRPIIKYSTTTAIIDVEMKVIDAVDNSAILRRASYGMLQDEVAKYSLNLTKINVANAHKPKIYNIKSPEGAGIFGNNTNAFGNNTGVGQTTQQVIIEPIKINYTVLADKFNIVAKSESVLLGKKNFYGIGQLQIILHPFDNVIQFIVAQDVINDQQIINAGNGSIPQYTTAPVYMDMTNMGEIKMVIKNQQLSVDTGLYMASNQIDLSRGQVVFKLPASKMNDIRKIYDSGINVFYITATQDTGTTAVYSGLFLIYDSKDNVMNLNSNMAQIQASLMQSSLEQPSIITDPNTPKGTAIVTKKLVGSDVNVSPNVNGTPVKDVAPNTMASTSTSVESATIIGGVTYRVTTNSGINIDGVEWSSSNIKGALSLKSNPTNLTIKSDSLYSNNQYLDTLTNLKNNLGKTYVTTSDVKEINAQIEKDFKNNPRTGAVKAGEGKDNPRQGLM